jgi:predicted NAD/FAD-dependent oxidoreductase
MTRIAIIGAGMAGLTLANELSDHARVTVFEKSRVPGGRMATRSPSPYAFDHGAQFFTAKSPEFQAQVAEWVQAGVVQSWNVRFAEFERDRIVATRDWDDERPHYVGVPGMRQIGNYLATGIDIELHTTVTALRRVGKEWRIETAGGNEFGPFDWVISTAPAAQTASLLPDFAFQTDVQKTKMLSCYALMLGFPETVTPQLDWQAALLREADISWISVNSSKPGRGDAFSLVVHSTNAYAEGNLETDQADVEAHLLAELQQVTGMDTDKADHCVLHRWRYANIEAQDGEPALLDPEQRLGVCGDWLIHGRVEAAFLSATQLAKAIRQQF